jgi:hypothetical protein
VTKGEKKGQKVERGKQGAEGLGEAGPGTAAGVGVAACAGAGAGTGTGAKAGQG